MRTTNPAAAVAFYRRSVDIVKKLQEGTPDDSSDVRGPTNARLGLAIALREQRKYSAAREKLRLIAMQGEMMARTPVRSVIREDMFDAQIALGELQLQMRNAPGAEASLNNALEAARILMEKNPKSLYSERCLASQCRCARPG